MDAFVVGGIAGFPTPDGTPVVGPTRYANHFLNTGHGMLGWTMACGSGRLLADLVTDRA